MTDRVALRASIIGILSTSAGLSPDNVADAIVTAVCGPVTEADLTPSDPLPETDPAVTQVPRDETADSIDSQTGLLTAEATAKRAADQAALDAAQADDDAAKTEADGDDQALADAQAKDDAAHQRLADADAAVAADKAALAQDDTGPQPGPGNPSDENENENDIEANDTGAQGPGSGPGV